MPAASETTADDATGPQAAQTTPKDDTLKETTAEAPKTSPEEDTKAAAEKEAVTPSNSGPSSAPAAEAPAEKPQTWRQRLFVPLLVAWLAARAYNRVSGTTRGVLAQGETPRLDDVLIASMPGASRALVAVLEAAALTSVPDLELGSTRAKFGTDAFDSEASSGFWLDPATAKRLNTLSALAGGGKAAQGGSSYGNDVSLRFFSSHQPLNVSRVGASELQGTSEDSPSYCGDDDAMLPYACLCPNCPHRWNTIIYVVDDAPCRSYGGVKWQDHVASFVDAERASVSLLSLDAGPSATVVKTPTAETTFFRQRILIIRDPDVRKRPVTVALHALSFVLDSKYDLRGATANLDRRLFELDRAVVSASIRAQFKLDSDTSTPFVADRPGGVCHASKIPGQDGGVSGEGAKDATVRLQDLLGFAATI